MQLESATEVDECHEIVPHTSAPNCAVTLVSSRAKDSPETVIDVAPLRGEFSANTESTGPGCHE